MDYDQTPISNMDLLRLKQGIARRDDMSPVSGSLTGAYIDSAAT